MGRARRFRWYHLALPLVAVALPFALYYMAEPVRAVHRVGDEWLPDEGEYAGAAACRDCHADIYAKQLASSHANTVRDLSRSKPHAPFGTGQKVPDPLTGAEYQMALVQGRPTLQVTLGGQKVSHPVGYEFGSGYHAFGYLLRLDEQEWVDARLNWYRRPNAWGFTSTQEKPQAHLSSQPLGRPNDAIRAAQCFQCHSTVLRAQGVGKPPMDGSQLRLRPEKSDLTITCEACHGPMGRHVVERRQRLPVQPRSRWSADELNQVCGRCHGIKDINPSHPVVARFQPYGLSRSRCFLASGGAMNCNTCHDPHDNASRDAVFYNERCLHCHGTTPPTAIPKTPRVQARPCPVNPKAGCTGCHMPVDSTSMPHTTFTDHFIRPLPRK